MVEYTQSNICFQHFEWIVLSPAYFAFYCRPSPAAELRLLIETAPIGHQLWILFPGHLYFQLWELNQGFAHAWQKHSLPPSDTPSPCILETGSQAAHAGLGLETLFLALAVWVLSFQCVSPRVCQNRNQLPPLPALPFILPISGFTMGSLVLHSTRLPPQLTLELSSVLSLRKNLNSRLLIFHPSPAGCPQHGFLTRGAQFVYWDWCGQDVLWGHWTSTWLFPAFPAGLLLWDGETSLVSPCTLLFLTELKSELAISPTTNVYRQILIVNVDFKEFSSLWELLKWLKCLNVAVESLFPIFWWCWGLNTFPHVWERQAKAAILNDSTTLSWAWLVVLHSQSLPGPQAPVLSNVLGSTGFEGVGARG